jgi:hypothetical protein
MSRGLVTRATQSSTSRAIVRFLATGPGGRGVKESQRHAAGEPATAEAAGRDREAESADAVAGSEFVDDRIRLRE